MITIENNDKDITIENDKNQPYVKKIILNKDITIKAQTNTSFDINATFNFSDNNDFAFVEGVIVDAKDYYVVGEVYSLDRQNNKLSLLIGNNSNKAYTISAGTHIGNIYITSKNLTGNVIYDNGNLAVIDYNNFYKVDNTTLTEYPDGKKAITINLDKE